MTSPSIGTIRVSCDSPHQILVTASCAEQCNNFIISSNGTSPLTLRGLDPGIRYSVIVDVFDGDQRVLNDETVTKVISVIPTTSCKNNDCICKQLHVASYSLNICM